jgi:cyclase
MAAGAVFLNGGRVATDLDAIDWAKRGVEPRCGELLLTSMNADGTKMDLRSTDVCDIATLFGVPVIALR